MRCRLPINDDILSQQSAIDMRVKNVRDFAWGMLVPKSSILMFFCLGGIGIHGDKARDEWEVIEYFPCFFLALAINNVSIFATIWTLNAVLVFPCKTATGVDTTVIADRLET